MSRRHFEKTAATRKTTKKANWWDVVPDEIVNRFDDAGQDRYTLQEVLDEIDYVFQMIKDGGCDYNDMEEDEPQTYKTMMDEMKTFKKKYGKR